MTVPLTSPLESKGDHASEGEDSTVTRCLVCLQAECRRLIDFGPQPISHHFYDGTHAEGMYPLSLGQCQRCGLTQLVSLIPPEEAAPRFDWLVNNEPEGHLDSLVEALVALPGISLTANVCGVSHKDESTLKRLREKGFQKTWRISPSEDLGISHPRAGIELIQQRVKPSIVPVLRSKYGAADVIIARHVLEHTHEPLQFMQALRELVRPGGYIVFEIPDTAAPFDLLDYTAMWEEHTLYFNARSLPACLSTGGLRTVQVESFPAPYETAVVAIASPGEPVTARSQTPDSIQHELTRTSRFAASFLDRKASIRKLLTEWKEAGQLAVFGAGHHAAMFLNLMGLKDMVKFVVDDHPKKKGMQMPGSRLQIVGSERLYEDGVKFCLSSLGYGSERKVLEQHRTFVERGGTFASIFATQPGQGLTFLAGSRCGLEQQ
jgi:hypothetical protein